MFHANAGHEKHIITNMKVIESRLQLIMGALAAYLSNKEMERNVWDDICTLEKDIQSCAKEALVLCQDLVQVKMRFSSS